VKETVLRPASVADAEQVAAVHLASRAAFIAFAPIVHSEAQVRDWVATVLIPGGGATVAIGRGSIGPIVGMMVVSRQHGIGWIDLGDGSNNEEHCPDILYEWVATEPHLLRG
jgi:hypothetical protein